MSPDTEPMIQYTFKEVLERLEGKIDALQASLDKDMQRLEERVDALETFRSRFLPTSVIAALLAIVGLLVDIYFRF